jgi:hypothetical protein
MTQKQRQANRRAQAKYRAQRKAKGYHELHTYLPVELWADIQELFCEAIDIAETKRLLNRNIQHLQ